MKKYLLILPVLAILLSPSFTSAATVEELQALINQLQAQIQSLQTQLSAQGQGQTQWCYDFNVNLKIGDKGNEVKALRTVLIKEGFDPGDIPGGYEENITFSDYTASAVSSFQEKYKDEVLTPLGLKYATGFVGPATRAKLNSLYGCGKVVVQPSTIPTQPSTYNQPPVISGVSGPITLKVNETGTWIIKASDPEQGVLTYSVVWGDETTFQAQQFAPKSSIYTQTATFTHSYSKIGTYNPTFIVTDSQYLSAKTSVSVNIGEIAVETGSVKITVMGDTGIRCVVAPCPGVLTVLYNAKVSVYNEKGSYIGTKDTSGGAAVFENLPVGTYTAIASAEGYADGKSEFKIVANVGGYLTINLWKKPIVSSITFLSPAGGEQWQIGIPHQITLNQGAPYESNCNNAPSLVDSNNKVIGFLWPWFDKGQTSIQWDTKTVSSWACGTTSTYSIIVQPGKYKIHMTQQDTINGTGPTFNIESNYFNIVSTTTPSITPSITVLSPNGGETWTKGTTQTIKWQDNTPVPLCPSGAICVPPAPKYYDIKLVLYYPPYTTGELYIAPYTIAKSVYGSSYTWSVGKVLDINVNVTGATVLDGPYLVQICQTGSATCDSSDGYFKIVSGAGINSSPVINGIPAIPSDIKVGQFVSFSWGATDADGDNLSWSVSWGDGTGVAGTCQSPNPQNKEGWTFNTSYAWKIAGTYAVKTTVNDCRGGSDEYAFNVTVGESIKPSITVLSPNGGETWTKGTTQTIKWQDNTPVPLCPSGAICVPPAPKYYDIKLVLYYPPYTTGELYIAPYTIAKSVYGSSYTWSVGKVLDINVNVTGATVLDGPYLVQICQTGSATCDSSDGYFKIVSGAGINSSPVINGIPAIPSDIKVGQFVSFSWGATDADGDNLSWSVSWGDGTGVAGTCQSPNPQNKEGWTFNTSYAWKIAGTYAVKTTVNDCRGGSDEYAFNVTVQVVGVSPNPSDKSDAPFSIVTLPTVRPILSQLANILESTRQALNQLKESLGGR